MARAAATAVRNAMSQRLGHETLLHVLPHLCRLADCFHCCGSHARPHSCHGSCHAAGRHCSRGACSSCVAWTPSTGCGWSSRHVASRTAEVVPMSFVGRWRHTGPCPHGQLVKTRLLFSCQAAIPPAGMRKPPNVVFIATPCRLALLGCGSGGMSGAAHCCGRSSGAEPGPAQPLQPVALPA
jgi:hypothetical protein